MEQTVTKVKKDRILWIDVAKGLGVFLIFFGHLIARGSVPIINQLIYAFHVPFFFILSGFVFFKREDERFLGFVSNKAQRLLVPLTIFISISLISEICIDHVTDPIMIIKDFFYYDGTYGYNMPCWFFITLFFIYIIAYLIRLQNQKIYIKTIIMVVFFVVGYLLYLQKPYLNNDVNPAMRFGLNKTIIAFGFFALGSILRDLYNTVPSKMVWPLVKKLFVPSSLLLVVFGVILNPKVSFYGMNIANYWYFILSSMFGSFAFIIVSMLTSELKIVRRMVSAWGRHSLLIVGTHYIWGITFVDMFIKIFEPILGTWKHDVGALIYTTAMLCVYVVIGTLLDRYVPFITGKKRNPQNNKLIFW